MHTEKSTEHPRSAKSIDPATWVSLHADYLYSYALGRVNDEEEARDLVQDTFLAALKQVTKFEGRSSERTWLTAILKFKIIDLYRKRSSLKNRPDPVDLPSDDSDFFNADDGHWNDRQAPEPFSNVNDPLHEKEFNTVLKKCMEKLPPLWTAVFTMKLVDDESTDTICSELKLTSSNFWVIIHRAKLNLRACLQKNWI